MNQVHTPEHTLALQIGALLHIGGADTLFLTESSIEDYLQASPAGAKTGARVLEEIKQMIPSAEGSSSLHFEIITLLNSRIASLNGQVEE
ncbi:hypothetical protein [Lichenifustis flavocetrariae]|uniref:Uncharacterized protein n=1 Tax=Lichenifustis flavocetrariae TaxID=2949735 RepID=A0AA42CMB4_9HYPH|nr:hypothetical protein [Lichenifustis flavocetrariae]MCW6512378.1 hypothetical protein [Lichenifustis flavocetrariae]